VKIACAFVLTAFACGAALAQEEGFDAKKELTASLEKLSKAKSYAFTTTTAFENTGGGFGGDFGGGRRGGRGRSPTETKGKYNADAGVVATMGDTKVARRGDRVVYTDDNGNWQPAKEPNWEEMRSRFQFGGGFRTREGDQERNREGGRERNREGGQDDSGRPGGPRVQVQVQSGNSDWRGAQYARFDAPHKTLGPIPQQLESVDAAEETEHVDGVECAVLTGKISAKGIEELMASGFGGRGRRGQDSGDDNVKREYSGRARFWLDDEGTLRQAELVTDMSIDWGAGSFQMKTTTVTRFSGFGETDVELPARAEDALKKAEEAEEKKDK
jgi:hypothetical protein